MFFVILQETMGGRVFIIIILKKPSKDSRQNWLMEQVLKVGWTEEDRIQQSSNVRTNIRKSSFCLTRQLSRWLNSSKNSLVTIVCLSNFNCCLMQPLIQLV